MEKKTESLKVKLLLKEMDRVTGLIAVCKKGSGPSHASTSNHSSKSSFSVPEASKALAARQMQCQSFTGHRVPIQNSYRSIKGRGHRFQPYNYVKVNDVKVAGNPNAFSSGTNSAKIGNAALQHLNKSVVKGNQSKGIANSAGSGAADNISNSQKNINLSSRNLSAKVSSTACPKQRTVIMHSNAEKFKCETVETSTTYQLNKIKEHELRKRLESLIASGKDISSGTADFDCKTNDKNRISALSLNDDVLSANKESVVSKEQEHVPVQIVEDLLSTVEKVVMKDNTTDIQLSNNVSKFEGNGNIKKSSCEESTCISKEDIQNCVELVESEVTDVEVYVSEAQHPLKTEKSHESICNADATCVESSNEVPAINKFVTTKPDPNDPSSLTSSQHMYALMNSQLAGHPGSVASQIESLKATILLRCSSGNVGQTKKVSQCHPEETWKSRYKVVNKRLPTPNEDTQLYPKKNDNVNSVKANNCVKRRSTISSSVGAFRAPANKNPLDKPTVLASVKTLPSCSVKSLGANKFRLVNSMKNSVDGNSSKEGSSAGKLVENVNRFSSGVSKRTVICGSDRNQVLNIPKSDVQHANSANIAAFTPVKRKPCFGRRLSGTPAFLRRKMNELQFIESTEYEGYDLTHITPEELMSLDHKSLLKLSAFVATSEKKPKSFIKKSKYKIVTKQKSSCLRGSLPQGRRKRQSQTELFARKKHYPGIQKRTPFRPGLRRLPSCLRDLSHISRNRKTNFVMIGDIPYKVSRTKIQKTMKQPSTVKSEANSDKSSTVVVVRGMRYEMDPSRQSLKVLPGKENHDSIQSPLSRIYFGGRTYVKKSPGVLTESPASKVRSLASRVLHRSIQRAVAADSNIKKPSNYCMFYNRFGKCNRGEKCPYIHDPSNIAVCTRFLRGSCKIDNCPFSHEKNPGKMAICSFFLQGSCTARNCLFRHETLKPGTELCKAFVKGYCSLGNKCEKAHILICPEYARGSCDKGAQCPYPHPPRKERKIESDAVNLETTSSEPVLEQPVVEEEEESMKTASRYFSTATGEADDASVKTLVPERNQVNPLPMYLSLEFNNADCLS